MLHSFDTDHAAQYGLHEAILIQNIHFWIAKNQANRRHFYDGKYWTYNSAKAFAELFPYMTVNQVRRALDRLVELEILDKGNYNQSAYDRTSWYGFSDKWISSVSEIHLANLPNGNGSGAEPIPDRKPDPKPVGKPDRETAPKKAQPTKPDGVTDETWTDWLALRASKKAAVTGTVLKMATKEAEKAGLSLEDFLQIWCVRGSQGLQADWLKPNDIAGYGRVAGGGTRPLNRQEALEQRNRAVASDWVANVGAI